MKKATTPKRLRLLSTFEKEDIYRLPQFTQTEREHYFLLTPKEKHCCDQRHQLHSKLHFTLQLGYFKAKHQLFKFRFHQAGVQEDAQYILSTYFKNFPLPTKQPSAAIISKNNQQILQLIGYQVFTKSAEKKILLKLNELTRTLSKPVVMLRELLLYLDYHHFIIPAYSTLQKWMSLALSCEEKRLYGLIKNHLSQTITELLEKLITVDAQGYPISALKHYPKNFNYKQIQEQIILHRSYYDLYLFAKQFLPKLGISNQNIQYYASLVDHYDARALRRFKTARRHLYFICYIYHRFQIMNDQMMQTFLHYVNDYMKEAKLYAKQQIAQKEQNFNQDLPKAARLLSWFIDDDLGLNPFHQIQKKAARVMPKDHINAFVHYAKSSHSEPLYYEWEYHAEHYRTMIKNIRPVFQLLRLEANESQKNLMKAVDFIKKAQEESLSLSQCKPQDIPSTFIPTRIKHYLLEEPTASIENEPRLHPYKYEFFVYQQLKQTIDATTTYANDTTQYKSFEDDLDLKCSAEEILHILTDTKLNMSIEQLLNQLEKRLSALETYVNDRILSGENKSIKIKEKNGKKIWRLPYIKKEEEINNPFYDKLPLIPIEQLLDFINDKCHLMRAFIHIKPHGAKHQFDWQCIKACLIANGTGLGIFKLADSCNLSYDRLRSAESLYIRLETLTVANDILSEAMAALPIFKHYDIEENVRHGSGDGQKHRTRRDTFKARHSPKYYGLGKGLVPYTLLINHIPVNVKMIGAHEHESHHLYDVLFNASADINIDRVSTDTAGSNQVNFALLDARGVAYAPCYRNINNKTKWIGSFKEPDQHNHDYLIKPAYKFNKKLIIREWPNILSIFAALMKKETTQSVIIKKLSSSARKCKTKEALWEYNNILLSIYLLQYIDDPKLRRYVRVALNRGEAYHQLRRIIGDSNGTLRGSSDLEAEIWNECSRLLANAIIFYNAQLLSAFMELKEAEGDWEAVEFIRKLSPVALQHIILKGRYEFCKDTTGMIDMKKMMEILEEALKKHKKSKSKKS